MSEVRGGSPFGCLALILTVFLLWAALFGVSYEGKHYGLSCSCDRGVVVEKP